MSHLMIYLHRLYLAYKLLLSINYYYQYKKYKKQIRIVNSFS